MVIIHMNESLYLITFLLKNRYCYCSYERVIVLNYFVCAKQTNNVLSNYVNKRVCLQINNLSKQTLTYTYTLNQKSTSYFKCVWNNT